MTSVLPREDELAALAPAPGSITWRRASDLRLGALAGTALLLQVAHPTVGAGVAQHSDFRADPWGRLLRTLDYVNGSIYGGPELAGTIGRNVRAMHQAIKGTKPDGARYHALEPDAYAWVHATLALSIVDGHATFGTPLSAAEQRDFWAQWRAVGRLIGVRDRDLPEDWADFRPYVDGVVRDVLEPTEAVGQVLDALARPTAPPVPLPPGLWPLARRPASAQALLGTVGALPPALRETLGLPWGRVRQRAYDALGATLRATGPLLPERAKVFGPAYLRLRRDRLAHTAPARFTKA